MGYIDVFVFLMPLYALHLNFTATEIGWLVGARTVLTLLISIHIGTLMDRFGTLQVMRVTSAPSAGDGRSTCMVISMIPVE